MKRTELYRKKLIAQQQEFEQEKEELLKKIAILERKLREKEAPTNSKKRKVSKFAQLETTHSDQNNFSGLDW